MGVLMDDDRKRLEYWVTNEDIDIWSALNLISDVTGFPVRDANGVRQVAHIYDPKRVTQTRGVSAFAPIFDALGMYEDINFARIIQQQIVSCFAIFRERTAEWKGGAANPLGQVSQQLQPDGSELPTEGLQPGMEYKGQVGEKFNGFSPNVPSEGFFEHMRMLLTIIGINLGLPLVLTMMDASETNFSGYRGAVDQARLGFRRNQLLLINRFHRPVWKWLVGQWMAKDHTIRALALRGKLKPLKHDWTPPGWPYIQPLDDAKADALRLGDGQISRAACTPNAAASLGTLPAKSSTIAPTRSCSPKRWRPRSTINSPTIPTPWAGAIWRHCRPAKGPRFKPPRTWGNRRRPRTVKTGHRRRRPKSLLRSPHRNRLATAIDSPRS